MPVFSIIIPLYNKEDHILQTINSVFDQEEEDYEIIVINDGSTDDSERIILELNDPRVHYFKQVNQGVSSARNLGIQKANGSFIALLDADDYWYPNHLSEFRKSIHTFPKQQVFCNNYSILLTDSLIRNTSFSYLPNDETLVLIDNYFRSSLLDAVAWTSAVCIAKDLFEKGYYFDTSISSGQDTDLWIRLALNYSFVLNRTTTALYKKNITNSLSKTNQVEARTKILFKFIEEEKTNTYLKKFIDLNRFSTAIAYKMNGDKKMYVEIKSAIAIENLHPKQRFLLQCPPILVRIFYSLKSKFLSLGIHLSSFK